MSSNSPFLDISHRYINIKDLLLVAPAPSLPPLRRNLSAQGHWFFCTSHCHHIRERPHHAKGRSSWQWAMIRTKEPSLPQSAPVSPQTQSRTCESDPVIFHERSMMSHTVFLRSGRALPEQCPRAIFPFRHYRL